MDAAVVIITTETQTEAEVTQADDATAEVALAYVDEQLSQSSFKGYGAIAATIGISVIAMGVVLSKRNKRTTDAPESLDEGFILV